MNSPLENRRIRLRGLQPRALSAMTGHEHAESRFISRAPGSGASGGIARRSFEMTDWGDPRRLLAGESAQVDCVQLLPRIYSLLADPADPAVANAQVHDGTSGKRYWDALCG
jgi:hypothetical protein